MQNIIETLQVGQKYNNFLKMIFDSEFDRILEQQGPFTVFAPVDAAFQNLPDKDWAQIKNNKEELRKIISEHMLRGKFSLKNLGDMDEVITMQNSNLAVERHEGGLIIGSAKIVESSIECSNGVIHGIDLVLLP